MNLTKQQIDAISNLGLAHMGDCVFEILCRGCLCAQGETTVDRLHRDTIAMVKATAPRAPATQSCFFVRIRRRPMVAAIASAPPAAE